MAPVDADRHFDAVIVRMAVTGGVMGIVFVVGLFAVGILVTGINRNIIAAAGIAAPFGGGGFGAMLGAVLGGIRSHENEEATRRTAAE